LSIRKESDGTYTVWYSQRHPVTKAPRKIIRKKIKTKTEAKRVEKKITIELIEKFRDKICPTWEQVVDEFLVFSEESGITYKVIENRRLCLNAYTSEDWGSRRVDDITALEIRKLIESKTASKSPSQQKNILKYIRLCFEYAVESGYISRNPTPKMKFKVGDKIKKVLTPNQVSVFLNMAKEMNVEWYPHWCMAIYTGMRNGELYALTKDKVNLELRQIKVDCSWDNKAGFKTTKSSDERIVEIAPSLLPIVAELMKNKEDNFLLPRIDKWDRGEQARELRMFLAGMGLPQIRFHDLRATWCTIMLGMGIAPIKVMKMGGWKDMKTMQIYSRMAGVDISGISDHLTLHDV